MLISSASRLLLVGALLTGCSSSTPTPSPRTVAAAHQSVLIDRTWSVKRIGAAYVIDHPRLFTFSLPTAPADPAGWSLVEATAPRVRFRSAGQPSSLTVYADGRAYCDGEFKAIDEKMPYAEEMHLQNQSPAEIDVASHAGRVDRSTRGDENNDGYNESSGAYQLIAVGPRIEFTITPRTPTLSRPVIEIANLPSGAALVTLEGQLVNGAARLPNGNLLVELPARLSRPTLVNIRVQ